MCRNTLATTSYEIPGSSVFELEDNFSQEQASGNVYPIYVKLPRSYHRNSSKHSFEKHYPVIYLTDAPYTFPLVSGAVRFPMNSGVMEEAIIVGVGYAKGSRGQASRVRDFTPVKAQSWKMITGGAAAHADFFSSVLLPFISNKYRTENQKRTFVGNSLGGLFGAYLLFNHPALFDSYIIGSPSVWFDDDYILSTKLDKLRKLTSPVQVYVSVGKLETPEHGEGQDMVMGAQKLATKIKALEHSHISLKFSLIENARHATAFPTTVIQGLDWIYGKGN